MDEPAQIHRRKSTGRRLIAHVFDPKLEKNILAQEMKVQPKEKITKEVIS